MEQKPDLKTFYRGNLKWLVPNTIFLHHVKELAVFVHENRLITLEDAYACEPIWNVDNGQTLCERCHNEHHRSKKAVRRKTI